MYVELGCEKKKEKSINHVFSRNNILTGLSRKPNVDNAVKRLEAQREFGEYRARLVAATRVV